MQFYHNIITQKSFEFLQKLNQQYDFILIGGWAVFLYSHSIKSKDIDIILEYHNLARLKEKYDVFKNDRLKSNIAKIPTTLGSTYTHTGESGLGFIKKLPTSS